MRIETAATASGMSAMNEAKTKARTTRAPRAPSSVSSSTPGPPPEPLDVDSSVSPVVVAGVPGGAACCRFVFRSSKIVTLKPFGVGGNASAYCSRPPSRTKRRVVGLGLPTTRNCGLFACTCGEGARPRRAGRSALGEESTSRLGWFSPPLP